MSCDGSNINPAALALLNFKFANGQYAIPSPQINLPVTDPTQDLTGESTFAPPISYNEDQYTVNFDQVISGKNQISEKSFTRGRLPYSRSLQMQQPCRAGRPTNSTRMQCWFSRTRMSLIQMW